MKDDSARFVEHGGRTSLFLPDGFAFANDVRLRNGTIEADVEAYPDGGFFGVAFHVASPDQYENMYFRAGTDGAGIAQYAPSWFNMNAWQFYPAPDYLAAPDVPVGQWVHIRIVIRGLDASLFVDTASTPTLIVRNLAQGSTTGSIGFWARYGGGYLSNVRYRPDTTSYATTPEQHFVTGAVTDGWTLSDALPTGTVNADTYPSVRALQWQPVRAEREGIVMIGRYRRDPNVPPPKRVADAPGPSAPGAAVVFARTTVTATHAGVRKMWIGYSDDVVVYLNGRPLYAGRNSSGYRDPQGSGWFYPYADAVYLPLEKGANELLLAVTESFGGWGFMCRFDP